MKNNIILFFSLLLIVGVGKIFSQNPVYTLSITQSVKAPVKLAIDASDNIYVTDDYLKCILKYNSSGQLIDSIFVGISPLSVAINNAGQLFVGDGKTGKIYKVNTNGSSTDFYSGCAFPSSMTFSPDGVLYIADGLLKKVLAVDQTGHIIQTIGEGTLIFPSEVVYDNINKRILIAEHGGVGTGMTPICKIWKFKLDGTLIGSIASVGNKGGQFYRIQGMTLGTCGNLYVCDPFQATISVFNNNDEFVSSFGQFGSNPGELNVPIDIQFDSKNRILVTSMNNSAIEVFDYSVDTTVISKFSYVQNELQVSFTNNSQDASSYTWNFGDGTTSTEMNPIHTYTTTGIYNVKLIASNNTCNDNISSQTIFPVISNVTKTSVKESSVSLYPNPSQGACTITTSNINSYVIDICNSVGQAVYTSTLSNASNNIDLNFLPAGLYTVKIKADDFSTIKKLIINK